MMCTCQMPAAATAARATSGRSSRTSPARARSAPAPVARRPATARVRRAATARVHPPGLRPPSARARHPSALPDQRGQRKRGRPQPPSEPARDLSRRPPGRDSRPSLRLRGAVFSPRAAPSWWRPLLSSWASSPKPGCRAASARSGTCSGACRCSAQAIAAASVQLCRREAIRGRRLPFLASPF